MPGAGDSARTAGQAPDLTVLILSYNVRQLLALAIRTAIAACRALSVEIIIVDNDSTDGSADMVAAEFLPPCPPENGEIGRPAVGVPIVRLIRSERNLGFAGGNNLGLRAAGGRHILLLNPDVVVHPHAFEALVRHLDAHPETGAVGGRIVNRDGTTDPGARRAFPSPSAAFYRMVGLSYVFPNSPRFGRYNLSWLDENAEQEVEALSGCFMCVRREVVDRIGGLDETFFMYGEDLDWSYRIRSAGWRIVYLPEAEIIHFKGESTRSLSRARQLWEFHRAMHIFVRKHIAGTRSSPVVYLIELGIFVRGIGTSLWRLFVAIFAPILDLAALGIGLAAAIGIRAINGWAAPAFGLRGWALIATVFLAAGAFGAIATGLYRRDRHDPLRAAFAAMVGAMMCIVAIFFIRSINFSRIVTGLTWIIAGALAAGWRAVAKPRASPVYSRGLVLGCGPRAERFLRLARRDPAYRIIGIVRGAEDAGECAAVGGTPVIGEAKDLPLLLRRLRVDDLILAWEHYPYSELRALIRGGGRYPRRIRLVPDDLPEGNGPADDWPLIDLDVHRRRWR